MKSSVVQQLNQLNKAFYTKTAEAFDATRQQPWQGWIELGPAFTKALEKQSSCCLDIGCGNGRLALHLIKEVKNNDWQYVGVDSSKELLEKAKASLGETTIPVSFIELDIVEAMLNNSFLPLQEKPTLITLFGILHHIPSYELRLELFNELRKIASLDTTFVATTWQFIEDKNLMDRKVSPEVVGVDAKELENNDYIITWEREVSAHRYCHYTSDEELQKLAQESGWHVANTFTADGKSNTLNHYFVLSPT